MKTIPLLIIAGALLIGAPFAYLTLATPNAPTVSASVHESRESPASLSGNTLTFIVKNDGQEAGDATFRLTTGDNHELDVRTLHLAPGETKLGWALEPATYRLALETPMMMGSASVDLTACEHNVATQRMNVTFNTLGGSIEVPGEECAHITPPVVAAQPPPAPVVKTYSATQHIDVWSTCGSHCTLTYMPNGRGGIAFTVPEGATRVVVTATWSASAPTNARLALNEYRLDADHVKEFQSKEGTSGIQLDWAHPTPGQHEAYAGATSDGTAVDQDVNLQVLVYS